MKHILSLNEYLQDDEVQLYNMFQMTWDEKYLECTYQWDYLLEDFLAIWKTDDPEELEIIEDSDLESYDKLEKFDTIGSNIRKKFGRWIFDNINNMGIDDIPSWIYFSEPKIIKNQWLIHCSDYASDIEKEGFTHGVDDINGLGLTTYIPHVAKSKGGFNFAYTVADFDRYGKGWGRHGKHNFKYGSEAVIFKTSGVRVWHSGDGEYQTIFLGKKAKNIVYLQFDDSIDKWFITSKITKNILVKKEKISDIAEWLDINYAQYHKHL